MRSTTGKGIKTWDRKVLTGEIYDHATTIKAKLNVTPAEVRRGALSVAEINDAGCSVHFDSGGEKKSKVQERCRKSSNRLRAERKRYS